MAIVVTPVESKADLDAFIRVQHDLHAGQPNFVPPLFLERQDALSPKKNPIFQHAEVRFWVARSDGRPVGRISAQICRLHREKNDPDGGQFGLIEARDDPAVFKALIDTAGDWLKSKGLKRMLGPFNLGINEQIGILVDGFDTPPALLMSHDQPHMDARLQEQGLAKAKDVLAFRYRLGDEPPVGIARILSRKLPANVRIRPLEAKHFDRDIAKALEIFNDAWADNWNALPYTAAEVTYLAKELKPLIEPPFFWFAEVDGEPSAFIIGLPNLNEAIADLGGRLLPFGLFKLLWRLKVKGVKTGRVPLMGVKRKLHGTTLGSVLPLHLIASIRKSALARGYETAELSWVLEDNARMRHIGEALCGPAYKTYRLYGKELN